MARNYLPPSLQDELPASVEEWQSSLATWLRDNAGQLSHVGRTVGVSLVHILVGMIIGGMVAFSHEIDAANRRPLAKAMVARVSLLNNAFHRIVFSQVRISALNTVLTGLFLTVVMPLVGSPLPFTKTMIVVTFVAGLLPVIGNLISNTVIVLISLSVSLPDAIGALVFLVLIHKLEYFLNARIIGGRISARAWELLIAMLVMEAAFGLPGLIAAPIYYAYLKDELSGQKLI
jgi:predicted PurR-regulated permease PerM